ncbi:hypothetical protein UAY_01715 [Enterococcus moraviensis ATCC BAA-383]|uniref:Lipoprotein n=1 Tax=Enterococcus moraviensis ATCC BAA-383 TaxID=1158609 RepID=R2TKI9_9ENTE|nr:hypothetical protein [Enterococcus moraviensis]EOI00612.1 hypothetical protein UAY_01715 [Enterococcus moraviensis ATCC BAA-383]EOT73159.1 hypothetical protein I586_00152 [Enterococcus moraviensis ATCC BAA-383]OJG68714.1 hypothetical protein RV09_GL000113 [Enterococcus moraviensis]
MKKISFALFISAIFLTACGPKTESSKNTKSTTDTSTVVNSTLSSESTIVESTASSSAIQTTVPSDVVLETSTQESSSSTIDSEEKAVEKIRDTQQFENDADITLIPWGKIDGDYLIKAQSKSLSEQGGSGTVGFYRVTPNGEVNLTDSQGN